jgi:hypothetical protein
MQALLNIKSKTSPHVEEIRPLSNLFLRRTLYAECSLYYCLAEDFSGVVLKMPFLPQLSAPVGSLEILLNQVIKS